MIRRDCIYYELVLEEGYEQVGEDEYGNPIGEAYQEPVGEACTLSGHYTDAVCSDCTQYILKTECMEFTYREDIELDEEELPF